MRNEIPSSPSSLYTYSVSVDFGLSKRPKSEGFAKELFDGSFPVFAVKELEKHPDLQPGPSAAASLPPRGSAAERGGPGESALDLAQAALLRVRAATRERSIDLRPAFGDHDE